MVPAGYNQPTNIRAEHVTLSKVNVIKFVLYALYTPEIGCSRKIGQVVLISFAKNIEINKNLISEFHDAAKVVLVRSQLIFLKIIFCGC